MKSADTHNFVGYQKGNVEFVDNPGLHNLSIIAKILEHCSKA